MKTLNPSNHNVANSFGDQSNIVTFNTTINNDITPLLMTFVILQQLLDTIEKQNDLIKELHEIIMKLSPKSPENKTRNKNKS